MNLVTAVYIINAVLLILHELESAYEREWEILHLPGKLTGFLIIHIPLIYLLFWGAVETAGGSGTGVVFCLIFGVSGLIPFLVHRVLVKTPDRFNRPVSGIILYTNCITGILLSALCIGHLR